MATAAPKARRLFNRIWHDVAHTNAIDTLAQELFTRDEDVAVLNGAAPHSFSLIQRSLDESLIIHLCRLTDPKGNGKRENLSIQRVVEATCEKLRANADKKAPKFPKEARRLRTQAKRLETRLKRLGKTARIPRLYRDKRLAHNDLVRSLRRTPLKRVTRNKIRKCLGEATDLMAHIGGLLGRTTDFRRAAVQGNGESVLTTLRLGSKLFRLDQRTASRGFTPEQLWDEVNGSVRAAWDAGPAKQR